MHRTLFIVRNYERSRRRGPLGTLGEGSAKRSVRSSDATRAQSSQSVTGARATPPWPKTSPASSSSKRGSRRDVVVLEQRSALPWLLGVANHTSRNATRSLRRYRQALQRLDGHRSLRDDERSSTASTQRSRSTWSTRSLAISRNRSARSCSWCFGAVSVTKPRPWRLASRSEQFALGSRALEGSYNYDSAINRVTKEAS